MRCVFLVSLCQGGAVIVYEALIDDERRVNTQGLLVCDNNHNAQRSLLNLTTNGHCPLPLTDVLAYAPRD
jgi:hypothetical protein